MTCEQLWYDHCVQAGRPPEPQPLPAHDLADPTLPLQLALAYVEGEAGYRPTSRRWPRPATRHANGPAGLWARGKWRTCCASGLDESLSDGRQTWQLTSWTMAR